MLPNHNTDNPDYSVYQMVLGRLPFLVDNDTNKATISRFTLELMNELENCFRVRFDENENEDWARVGNENFYTVLMRSIIADLVCVYILMVLGAGADYSTGTSSGTVTDLAGTTYIKKAKAGSVEVEYDQYDMKKSVAGTLMGTNGLISSYKLSAIRKAHTLGCLIDLNADGSVELFLDSTPTVPFLHIGHDCCGG